MDGGAQSNNFPAYLTSFVGRDRDLSVIVDGLKTTRLITLTGPGGSGKTRLAVAAARACTTGFPDGVWFVGLADGQGERSPATSLTQALGVVPLPSMTALQAATERFGNPVPQAVGVRRWLVAAGRRDDLWRWRHCRPGCRPARVARG